MLPAQTATSKAWIGQVTMGMRTGNNAGISWNKGNNKQSLQTSHSNAATSTIVTQPNTVIEL